MRPGRAVRAAIERVGRAVDDLIYYVKDVPPPVYVRCSECGQVGVQGYRRGGVRDEPAARNKVKAPMPPEYRCRRCDQFSPRVLGDEIDLDDPAVDVVDMICLAPHRLPVLRWFRCCYTHLPGTGRSPDAHDLTLLRRVRRRSDLPRGLQPQHPAGTVSGGPYRPGP